MAVYDVSFSYDLYTLRIGRHNLLYWVREISNLLTLTGIPVFL